MAVALPVDRGSEESATKLLPGQTKTSGIATYGHRLTDSECEPQNKSIGQRRI